jgi:hypothetical protein
MSKTQSFDLSPLVVETLQWQGRVLRANSPLVLLPHLDEETRQLYVVENPELDLTVCGSTRDELVEELTEYLFLTCDAYANDPPEQLTEKAQGLQANLQLFSLSPHSL